MKLNKKETHRELHAVRSDAGDNAPGFVICEGVKYIPYGFSHAKWECERVFVSVEELKKLLASVEG